MIILNKIQVKIYGIKVFVIISDYQKDTDKNNFIMFITKWLLYIFIHK